MIRLKDVSISFDGQQIFNGLNLEIDESAPTAIMGKSGYGKTTLLLLLGGLRKADSGHIEGVPGKIAYVFQEDRLLPWMNVLKNASIAGNEQTAKTWLQALGIDEMDKYPSELSGGMARRVAIARALSYPSDLLIMDEPFKGLDEKTRDLVIEKILETGNKIIFATHDAAEAEKMHAKIIRIDEICEKK